MNIHLNAVRVSKTLIAVALCSAIVGTPAAADRTYFGGGAGQFEDVVREHGSRIAQGARNQGSRAAEAARRNGVAIGRGISAINQSRTILGRGGPLPLIIVPEGYVPGIHRNR